MINILVLSPDGHHYTHTDYAGFKVSDRYVSYEDVAKRIAGFKAGPDFGICTVEMVDGLPVFKSFPCFTDINLIETDPEMKLLSHTLGVNLVMMKKAHARKKKTLPIPEFCQNRFSAGPSHSDIAILTKLAARGIMKCDKHAGNFGGSYMWFVSNIGLMWYREVITLYLAQFIKK